jgi:cytochrome P450
VFVPKGTNIRYSVYAMHRREDLFENAAEFRPERWETLHPTWEYLPFNGGPRICLGQQFSLTEASYTIIRLLQEFSKIESRDPGQWEEGLGMTCASFNGVKVGLIENA